MYIVDWIGGRGWVRTSDPCRVKALSHPFWVNGLDDITRDNNHIASPPIMPDHPESRWRCDKIVTRIRAWGCAFDIN